MNISMDKVKGALYGFAIGDAMGATNEFKTKEQIECEGKVTDLVGGGWLNLNPGEVTDDTQMMLCVIDAIMNAKTKQEFESICKENFIAWKNTMPKDIGNQCHKSICRLENGEAIPMEPYALGNGSLMRALPCALLGKFDWNIIQGRLTHNNDTCDSAIAIYTSRIMQSLVGKENLVRFDVALCEPSGHVANTIHNALYWSNNSPKYAILNAVNHGGDADTIAALAGGLSGAKYGFLSIPKEWVSKLDSDVRCKLDNFVNYVHNYYCTM